MSHWTIGSSGYIQPSVFVLAFLSQCQSVLNIQESESVVHVCLTWAALVWGPKNELRGQ